jgi:hypothetical protein
VGELTTQYPGIGSQYQSPSVYWYWLVGWTTFSCPQALRPPLHPLYTLSFTRVLQGVLSSMLQSKPFLTYSFLISIGSYAQLNISILRTVKAGHWQRLLFLSTFPALRAIWEVHSTVYPNWTQPMNKLNNFTPSEDTYNLFEVKSIKSNQIFCHVSRSGYVLPLWHNSLQPVFCFRSSVSQYLWSYRHHCSHRNWISSLSVKLHPTGM